MLSQILLSFCILTSNFLFVFLNCDYLSRNLSVNFREFCCLRIQSVDFVQVAEALPLADASVDAVVGTLVLCSVKDVDLTLKGI